MTLIIFIFILSILIVVHEFGHFWMARRAGVRVEEFALGFGRKIWSRKGADGTEYCLCAIPLGGYVKMAGDERDKCAGKGDEFFSKPVGQRALIAVMGPAVNFVLAYLCFVVVFWVGYVDMDASMKVLPAKAGKVLAGSPAERSGIMADDVIVRIGKTKIENWPQMQDTIMASGGKELQFAVLRAGAEVELKVIPEMQKTRDIFGREHSVSRVGLQPSQTDPAKSLVIRKYGFFGAFKEAGRELVSITVRTLGALWEIVTGQRSPKEGVTGLIGIFYIVKFAMGIGAMFLLHIVGAISASLAIFNLLPLIPLDGGHLALLGLEKLRRRPLSARTDDLVNKAGLVFMIALAVAVFYLDFERIGLIDKVIGFFHK